MDTYIMLSFVSGGGYHYQQKKNGTVVRVPKGECKKYGSDLKVGDTVTIIVKPYCEKNYETGKVARILTKKKFHSRGRKVKLDTGKIGRIV